MKWRGDTTANADDSKLTKQYQDGSAFLITELCQTNNKTLHN